MRSARNCISEFPGTMFYFLPADMITQILNFGLPAPIDVQVEGADSEGNRKFADQLLSQIRQVPGPRRSAHPAALRSAQAAHHRGPHQSRAGRLHADRYRQRHAGVAERQFPDHAHVLPESEERRHLQRRHADPAVPHQLAAGSAERSDHLARQRAPGDSGRCQHHLPRRRHGGRQSLQHSPRHRYLRLGGRPRSRRGRERHYAHRRRQPEEPAARIRAS